MFGNTIPGRKTARRLLCTLTHPQKSRTAMGLRRIHGAAATAAGKWVPASAGTTRRCRLDHSRRLLIS